MSGAIADVVVVPDTTRMKTFAFAALLLALPDCANAKEASCKSSLGAAVPDVRTAKAIATAVISARQTLKRSSKYRLVVEPDGDRPGGWVAFQSLPRPASRDPNSMVVIHGGGGLEMRIDRCTGEISNLHLSR